MLENGSGHCVKYSTQIWYQVVIWSQCWCYTYYIRLEFKYSGSIWKEVTIPTPTPHSVIINIVIRQMWSVNFLEIPQYPRQVSLLLTLLDFRLSVTIYTDVKDLLHTLDSTLHGIEI